MTIEEITSIINRRPIGESHVNYFTTNGQKIIDSAEGMAIRRLAMLLVSITDSPALVTSLLECNDTNMIIKQLLESNHACINMPTNRAVVRMLNYNTKWGSEFMKKYNYKINLRNNLRKIDNDNYTLDCVAAIRKYSDFIEIEDFIPQLSECIYKTSMPYLADCCARILNEHSDKWQPSVIRNSVDKQEMVMSTAKRHMPNVVLFEQKII